MGMTEAAYPQRLDLEITRKCKYNCGICSVRAQNNIDIENEVSLNDLRKKVSEFSELGGKEVSITGGEPTERGIGFLCDLIRFCKQLNLQVRMYTVGYGINGSVAMALKASGLDLAYVSLEGEKDVDEAYKGVKGSYDVAVRTIKYFKEVGIEVVIHFTPTRQTYLHFPHVIKVARELGVRSIRVMAFVPQGRGWDTRMESMMNGTENEIFGTILKEITQNNPELKLQFSGTFSPELTQLLSKNDKVSFSSCMLDKRRFVITSDGLMIPSFAVRMSLNTTYPDKLAILGDIRDVTAEEAWNANLILKQAHTHSNRHETCGNCQI